MILVIERTAQLSGLSQICLDAYYRTIKGIQVLIEKEWISFGHKYSLIIQIIVRFGDRCGHLTKHSKAHHHKECSPVFHQFIECVWQLMQQAPNAFEYNEFLLLDLFEQVYSCQYGNFLLNCEHDRLVRVIDKR